MTHQSDVFGHFFNLHTVLGFSVRFPSSTSTRKMIRIPRSLSTWSRRVKELPSFITASMLMQAFAFEIASWPRILFVHPRLHRTRPHNDNDARSDSLIRSRSSQHRKARENEVFRQRQKGRNKGRDKKTGTRVKKKAKPPSPGFPQCLPRWLRFLSTQFLLVRLSHNPLFALMCLLVVRHLCLLRVSAP